MISANAKPDIIQKMKVNTQQKVKCWQCKRVFWLVELRPKLYVDSDMRKFRPPNEGGNGYNYDCPFCKIPIYAPRW